MKSIKHYISTIIHHPTKVIWKVDKVFLGGRLKKIRNAQKEKKRLEEERFRMEHPEEWFDQQIATNLSRNPIIDQNVFSVRDILLAQFTDGEAVFYDIAVRLLVIEQYYGKNDIGYGLYSRMQELSGNGTFWLDRFLKLIKSCETNGYNNDTPLDLDEKLHIMDGAHRLSLALYNGIELIQAQIHQGSIKRRWNYNLFWELGFTSVEMENIQRKAIELFSYCKYQYVGAIWPPAFHLRDEIINEINTYLQIGKYHPLQNADCQVVKRIEVVLPKLEFVGLFRALYYADAMDEEGIKRKLQYIDDSVSGTKSEYPVCIFYLDVSNPAIIRNEGNNSARSQLIANIKKVIRSRYKNRINHYMYDNIMHISDNFIQSKFCDSILNLDKDMSDLFTALNNLYKYAIVKYKGRQSEDFPKSFYYYTDLDIIVENKDVRAIGYFIENGLKQKFDGAFGNWGEIVRRKNEDNQIEIMVLIYGWRCFMVHIQTLSHFNIDEIFFQECMENRTLTSNQLAYILLPQYDMMIRASELVHSKRKTWHRDFIAEYIDLYDEKLAKRAFNNLEYLNKVKNIIDEIKQSK